jgi:hypothetical protein
MMHLRAFIKQINSIVDQFDIKLTAINGDCSSFQLREFTDTEKAIFDYTCELTDSLKMCTLPSPKLDLRDLQAEKTLLRKEAELESFL